MSVIDDCGEKKAKEGGGGRGGAMTTTTTTSSTLLGGVPTVPSSRATIGEGGVPPYSTINQEEH